MCLNKHETKAFRCLMAHIYPNLNIYESGYTASIGTCPVKNETRFPFADKRAGYRMLPEPCPNKAILKKAIVHHAGPAGASKCMIPLMISFCE